MSTPRGATRTMATSTPGLGQSSRPQGSTQLQRNANGNTPAHAKANEKQFRVDSDVKAMAVSGHCMWLAHADGSMTVRKTRTAELAHHFSPAHGRVWALAAISLPPIARSGTPGMDAVWVGLSTGDIEVYEAATRQFVKRLSRHTGGIYCLVEFSGHVFSGSSDFEIFQWDARRMCFMRQLTGHSNYVRCLHAEGATLISGSDDHTVRLWSTASGAHLNTGRFHSTGVACMCRVGASMWSGDDSGKIAVWKISSFEHEGSMREHHGRVNVLRKLGSRVYSGGADHEIFVWDAYTAGQVARISDHQGWIQSLVCPAQLSRYYLWSAAADGTVRCWHHDEYRVMNSDMERFDDACWFNAEFSPFKELNEDLAAQVTRLERRCDLIIRDSVSKSSSMCEQTAAFAQLQSSVKGWEGELEASRQHAREAALTIDQLRAKLTENEKELSEMSERQRRFQAENVDLRCGNDKLRLDNEQLRRRLELSDSERTKLDAALRETLQFRADGSGTVPCIILSESDATSAVRNMQQQLGDAIQMNQALISELNKYKGILGLPPTPTLAKPLAMGASPSAAANDVGPPAPTPGAVPTPGAGVEATNQTSRAAAAVVAPAGTTAGPATMNAATAASTLAPAGPSAASGFMERGSRWSGTVGSYVQERYFGGKFASGARRGGGGGAGGRGTGVFRTPHAPQGRPLSARRPN